MLNFTIYKVDRTTTERTIVHFRYEFITFDKRVLTFDNVCIEYNHKDNNWAIEIYDDDNQGEPSTLFSSELELFAYIANMVPSEAFRVLYG